jgi:subtilase family serine protease
MVSDVVKLFGSERCRGRWRFLLLLVCAVCRLPAQASGAQVLHGHLPAAVARLQPVDRLPGPKRLQLAIGLPLRNQEALTRLLQEIYDPASPNYRHYLTPQQFAEMFGPTEEDYQAVINFAEANGLTVTGTHLNRVVLDVEGATTDIEKAFHVTMRVYQHPKEARTFYAPDVEPSLDLAVPILHVSGLDNYSVPHPHLRKKPADTIASATPNSGSGPGGSYRGYDFRAAYVPGTALTGSGQSVGLVQFDGYYASDIATYISQAGISTSVVLTNVPVNGGVGTPGSDNVEVALDIEMVISMAPGLSKVIVYEAPNESTPWVTILSQMANDTNNLAKQLSCSWGGGPPDPTSEVVFQQMALQGQTFFNASGDSDAFTGAIDFPSESPNIVQVGGTTLTTTGPGGSYVSETVWNWGGDVGSSGGISTYYSIPTWQQGISMSANQGSTTMRNIPDVALTADDVYVTYHNGSNPASGTFGGTSCAAPLWAGFTALVNQQAAANGKPPAGFINPAVYTIGTGTTYLACFHDITTGNNFSSSSPTKFSAVAGYDLCTGWGTPKGTNLINALEGTGVAVAELTITNMRVKLNFAKLSADKARLSAANLDLGAGYNLTNKVVTLDIGGAIVSFTLDAKGKGRGVNSHGHCRLAYKRKTGKWTLAARLVKGSWRTQWSAYGLVNADVPKTPTTTVTMPVVAMIDGEAFSAERSMSYTAKAGRSGTAQ